MEIINSLFDEMILITIVVLLLALFEVYITKKLKKRSGDIEISSK